MQTKLLNDVVSSTAGKPAVDIINLLFGKKNVNEFLIAKKLGMTINQIRNLLYKLSDANLVSFTRKKDKKKGWYTYYWTLNLDKAYELINNTIRRNIENLRSQLKSRKEKRFYICKNCNIEVSEETALLHEFICRECGEVYQLGDSQKIIKDLENNISRLEKEAKIVEHELGKIQTKKAKKIEKDLKKEKAERYRKRKLKAKKKQNEKNKKISKKTLKKKKSKKVKKIKKRKKKKKKRM